MADRSLYFSAPMIHALVEGRKTQSRRVLHVQPPAWVNFCEQPTMLNILHQWVPSGLWRWAELDPTGSRALRQWPLEEDGFHYWIRPRLAVGDRLWVREAWRTHRAFDPLRPSAIAVGEDIWWEADRAGPGASPPAGVVAGRFRPGRFMPRWASRLTLVVTDVRVQQVRSITPEDAKAEGAPQLADNPHGRERDALPSYRWGFAALWDSLHAARGFGWEANPWVAAVTFTVHPANIDTLSRRIAA